MSWINNIRNKPHEQKVRLIWITIIFACVILLTLWAVSARFQKNSEKDTSLFKTIGNGFNEIKNNYKK